MGGLTRVNMVVQQIAEAEELQNEHIPTALTHEQILESRRRLLQTAPPRVQTAPPRVPERFLNVRFSSTVPRPEVQGFDAALAASQEWVRRVAVGEYLLLALIGEKGTSKSHLAFCAAWDLYDRHRIHVPCYSWCYQLGDELRGGRFDETPAGVREVSPYQVRQQWHATRFCIVDECRPTSGTDFDAMELAKFSMQRYDHRRSALITCNWASLEELVGAPAADRFTQIKLVGPSFRGSGA
jgi:hypothetical protein